MHIIPQSDVLFESGFSQDFNLYVVLFSCHCCLWHAHLLYKNIIELNWNLSECICKPVCFLLANSQSVFCSWLRSVLMTGQYPAVSKPIRASNVRMAQFIRDK